MSVGFDCGDGWFELLNDLFQQFQHYNRTQPANPAIAVQVKEKFGGLRFYVAHSTAEVAAIIATAEQKSLQT